MADNSLVTKEHLRMSVEGLRDVMTDPSAIIGVSISEHNADTTAHSDIRELIPTSAADLNAPTIDEMNEAIGAISTSDASGQIETHNTDTTAHSDIRELIPTAASDLNAPTIDEMNEAIGAISTPDVSGQIETHNTDTTAHSDIRQAIESAMYTHPTYTAQTSGFYKITVNSEGHVSEVVAVTKDDIIALGIPSEDTDTTYSEATSSAAGLMSASDKAKLDGIEEGATASSGGSSGSSGVPIVTAESSDGVTYTGTLDGVTELTAGLAVIFVPNKTSASTAPTFNLNSLGAKTIKRRLSGMSSTLSSGIVSNWLYLSKPQFLIYDGTYWIVANQDKPMASDLYGTMSVEKLEVSSDNEGQVLKVVDGVPTWTNL